jgi:3-methyladenine DNA glycosylase/8-oxoguanine DNA glycosylase
VAAEATFRPCGPYRLRLMRPSGLWRGALPGGREALAWQRPDGAVTVRAPDADGIERARFMLALDDDTGEFHRRFARDPLLGPAARALVGIRPLRLATVAHATLRAVCGQLIEARRARAIERSILREAETASPTREQLGRFSAAGLRRHGLTITRASTLVRLCRTIDLERLRDAPGGAALARLAHEPGIGPWSCGVISLEGLGRYDHAIVGDLGLMKLTAALRGRWVEPGDTAELLAPYGEWQGLAGHVLLAAWPRGLVRGADADRGRAVRARARRGS